MKTCTPVHGLSVCLIAEKPESPCTGVHIFTFAHKSRQIWLLYQSRPISIFQLKLVERTAGAIAMHKSRKNVYRYNRYAQIPYKCVPVQSRGSFL